MGVQVIPNSRYSNPLMFLLEGAVGRTLVTVFEAVHASLRDVRTWVFMATPLGAFLSHPPGPVPG